MAYTHIQYIDIQMCIGMGTNFCCILRKHPRFREKNSRFQTRNHSLPMVFDGIVILLPFCTKLLRFALYHKELLQVLKGGAMVFLKVG